MKTGTAFRNDFFYFGRYAKDKYGCVEDLNVLMGKDIQCIYNNLKNIVDSLLADYISFN